MSAGGELRCLVLHDGRRGIENQALGLAEALGRIRPLTIQSHRIQHSKLIAAIPPKVQLRMARFDLPDCDIAIGCGRQAIAALLHVKHSRPDAMTVYIQDPRISPSYFDVVIAPEHDGLSGENVVNIIGSPNRVTQDRIISETLKFADGLARLAMPRAALLIGGTSKTHKLDMESHADHLAAAKTLLSAGHCLLVTTSRRTPESVVEDWKHLASDHTERVWLHTGDGPNPYFAFLGGAELILVTEDSTNMLTEACATGKPVYRLPMAGHPRKFANLYSALETRCGVAPYAGQISGEDYEPLDETQRAAKRVAEFMDIPHRPHPAPMS